MAVVGSRVRSEAEASNYSARRRSAPSATGPGPFPSCDPVAPSRPACYDRRASFDRMTCMRPFRPRPICFEGVHERLGGYLARHGRWALDEVPS